MMAQHSIDIPATHKSCPKDLDMLKGLLAWWIQRPQYEHTARYKARVAHLTRQLKQAQKELETHGQI